MSNNVFVDKTTGEKVRILEEDTNFYVLDNSVRIKKDVFSNKYEQKEEIDPGSFFSEPSANPLANMAEQLKQMDTSNMRDNAETGARVKYIEKPTVLSDSSLPDGDRVK
jgi:hypothetical protein